MRRARGRREVVGCGWCGEPDSIDPEAGRCIEGDETRPDGCDATWTWAHNTSKCPKPPPVVDPDLD